MLDGYSESLHKALIDEVLDAIAENGLRIELNTHVAELTGNIIDTYPDVYIVEAALNKGISFTFGSDAHKPECVGGSLNQLRKHEIYKKALQTFEN